MRSKVKGILKQNDIALIMRKLSKTYRMDSGVYGKVEKALNKLSAEEADALWAMVATSVESK